MAGKSVTKLFQQLHKLLKKYYKPVLPDANRSVLEHLLFACCLEDAPYERAEEGFAGLVHNFFDWNEVRVSTARELAEVLAGVPDPMAAARRVKRVLQHVFESTYSFDLEELRKKNLSQAVEELKKIDGTTPFTVSYVVQVALGGHSIPVDSGTAQVLKLSGIVEEKDIQDGQVKGLDRAIAKSKGLEFASLLHQLGADFIVNPFSQRVRQILLAINPECEANLPRRRDWALVPPEPEPLPVEEKPKKPKATAEKPPEPEKPKRRGRRKKSEEAAAEERPVEVAAEQPAEEPAGRKRRRKRTAKKAAKSAKKKSKSKRSTSISKRKPR